MFNLKLQVHSSGNVKTGLLSLKQLPPRPPTLICVSIQFPVLVDFLSLSDTFDDHSILRHQESEHSAASKEPSTNRSRIMSNISYAPPEYVKSACIVMQTCSFEPWVVVHMLCFKRILFVLLLCQVTMMCGL